MVEVCSLASGSNGNSFFIKTGDDVFLVDAGISCKQVCLRLEQLRVRPDAVKGIFITHEHSDHTRGLRVFLKKYPVPVYVTTDTYRQLPDICNYSNLHFIKSKDEVAINKTLIRSLPKSHDAVDPCLFSFYFGGKKISVITDAGSICHNVVEAVQDADVLFLETNYDEQMLWDGEYPYNLKQRIAGDFGHLANDLAGTLVLNHAPVKLQHVFLSHLSENNNTPEKALTTFCSIIKNNDALQKVDTIVASRYQVSPKVILQ